MERLWFSQKVRLGMYLNAGAFASHTQGPGFSPQSHEKKDETLRLVLSFTPPAKQRDSFLMRKVVFFWVGGFMCPLAFAVRPLTWLSHQSHGLCSPLSILEGRTERMDQALLALKCTLQGPAVQFSSHLFLIAPPPSQQCPTRASNQACGTKGHRNIHI